MSRNWAQTDGVVMDSPVGGMSRGWNAIRAVYERVFRHTVVSDPGPNAGDVFTLMLHALDRKDWASVRATFADQVDVDYSSLFGVPPAQVNADEQVAAWREFLDAFDATQHLTGPVVLTSSTDETAAAHAHVRAYHRMKGAPGGDTWMVAGHYEVRLAVVRSAWKITGLTLTALYQDGNLDMPQFARRREGTSGQPHQ